jgi:hypothetical protein
LFLFRGVRTELNRHLLVHSQICRDRYTTDTIYRRVSRKCPDQDSNPERLVRSKV